MPLKSFLVCSGLWSLLLAGSGAQAQEGYRLTREAVIVDQASHWQVWEAPIGAQVVEADGTVLPRFLRRDVNAMRDAGEFKAVVGDGDTLVGGIRQAGSNPDAAPFIMDGDLGTGWEPDPADGLDLWFVDVELGRSVIAQRVVVRFAEEGQADPFLKFRVLLADGREQAVLGKQTGLKFYRVGQVTWPNKDQREFSFEIRPQRPLPEGVEGEIAQVVRFQALDTDSTRGREVDSTAYQALPSRDQGVVEYFRQTVAGRQILVDQKTYEALPGEEKGAVHFFRRERPRLAELEVYTPGDNVVNLTQRLHNRDISLFENILLSLSTDGIFRSFYPMRIYDPVRDRNQLLIDLGARFWLDRIRLLSADKPLSAYQLRISDGTYDPSGSLVWEDFEERQNRESFLQLEERFPLREVRYLELRRLELVGSQSEQGNLSEFQAYGEGYVSAVELSSPLIRLGRSRMFTTLEWEGDAPPGTELEIRTRSGDDLLEETHYYDSIGREITKEEWEAIRNVRNRGEVVIREVPGPGWSNWSAVYQASGEAFKSPGPRRYALVQARLLTHEALRTARLRSLRLGLAPPLVDQTFAELWPVEGVAPGVDQEFALYLHPVFAPGDSGFDRLRLYSSSSASIELLSFKEGSEAELRAGRGKVLWPGALAREVLEDGSVTLIFPEAVTSGERVYEARFRTRVFLSGTVFGAELQRSTRPGVIQEASEGDAVRAVQSQSLVAVADVERYPLLDQLHPDPPVFTPNGDGVNDAVQLRFSVYRLSGEQELEIEIYDLAGQRLRELSLRRENPSGDHAVLWDGRDGAGRLVTPGIYVARVGFSSDAAGARSQAAALVQVVY